MEKKFLISVTGKSGVGKSVFSNFLCNKLDGELIGFDKISHLSLKDTGIKEKLRTIFGEDVFSDGEIDRKKMGKIVFNDKEKMQVLNDISQKFMEDYIDNLIKVTDKKFIILEYALITKMKYFEMSNFKILIKADKSVRFKRLKGRDNVSDDYLESREKNLPNFYENEFDFVFENSEEKEDDLKYIALQIAEKLKNR